MNYWTESEKNIYVAAHRGWCSVYPENTMAAFRAALEIGVDQIETDIRISKDGELVLIHDSTVDRTTDGSGKVCDMTLAQLQALDAGCKKDAAFAGERIPLFRDLMELVKDHPTVTLDLELKEYPLPGWEDVSYDVCDRVLRMVEEYGFGDRIVINTFNGKLHEYINKTYGNKYRQHVYYPLSHMGVLERNPYEYAFCCCMFRAQPSELNMATKEEFLQMAAFGVEPWAGACVADEKGVDLAIECGARLITCNNPDVILDLLRQKGYHQ